MCVWLCTIRYLVGMQPLSLYSLFLSPLSLSLSLFPSLSLSLSLSFSLSPLSPLSLSLSLSQDNVSADSALVETYCCYLIAFQVALCKAASPGCLLPADHPTLDFIVDMLVHLCSMPVIMCVYVYMCLCVCMYIYMCVCICVFVCVCICVCVCMCICVCVFIYDKPVDMIALSSAFQDHRFQKE